MYVIHPATLQLRHYHATPAAKMIVGGAQSAASSTGDVTSKYQISEYRQTDSVKSMKTSNDNGTPVSTGGVIFTTTRIVYMIPGRRDLNHVRKWGHLSAIPGFLALRFGFGLVQL